MLRMIKWSGYHPSHILHTNSENKGWRQSDWIFIWRKFYIIDILYLIARYVRTSDIWSARLAGGDTMTALLMRHNNLPRENLFVIWLSPAPFMEDKNKYHRPSHNDHHWENYHIFYLVKETHQFNYITIIIIKANACQCIVTYLLHYWSANMTK